MQLSVNKLTFLAIALSLVLPSPWAIAETVVVPSSRTNTEGNSGNSLPFGGFNGLKSYRYQQV